MTVVSIKEIRSNISSLINKVEHGEEVIITRRGKKVAILQGIPAQRRQFQPQSEFREKIRIKGQPMSAVVAGNRSEERY
ncbi:MAG: type II toxin-antitoxin system prevent-host-death family antitoxin [Chitinispirillaceae bacterium]|nr:type II toxin-antitoxin system prevent-host-death family antitoxin [Chitinispirillaceae bacterium]